jgi:hypothetical protein
VQVVNHVRQDLRPLLTTAVRKTSGMVYSSVYLLDKPLAAVKWLLKTADKAEAQVAAAANPAGQCPASSSTCQPAGQSRATSGVPASSAAAGTPASSTAPPDAAASTAAGAPASSAAGRSPLLSTALQELAPELLRISEVPMDVAMELVGRGFKPSYEQMVIAARAHVAGIEVWPKVCDIIGIPTGLPLAAQLVCSHYEPPQVSAAGLQLPTMCGTSLGLLLSSIQFV